MRIHDRSPAVVVGAVGVVALVLSVLGVSFARGGHTAPINPVIEVSNTCVVVNTAATLTIWGSQIPSGPHTLSSNHGQPTWLPATQVFADSLGDFTVTVTYKPTATTVDQVMLDQTTGPAILVALAGGCPTSTPPAQPCFAPTAAVPVSVSAALPAPGTATARWFLDYPGAGLKPVPFATTPVSTGSSSALLPASTASPGNHLVTVIALPPPAINAPAATYWTYPITFCQPAPPSTTTTTTTTTVAPTTTTTIHHTTTTTPRRTTTTVFSAPPTTVGPTPVLSIRPQVVSAGQVTQVHGVGFPPNSAIILEWEPGIGIVTAQVEADGAFTTAFLVMPNDQVGTRLVQASGFPPTVSAPLLVELGPSEPPSADGQFVFRRG